MLIFAAIAPHGGDILEQLAANPAVMAKTRAAMNELCARCQATQPEVVVVATPHGMLADGVITIGATRYAAGILGDSRVPNRHIKAVFETDLAFVAALQEEGETQNLPFVRLVDEKKKNSVLPLDWGALIPLWFTAHPLKPRPKVVVLSPDRHLPRETLVRAGLAIARAAKKTGKRVAFVASCDLGHAHDASGPYGFHPLSAEHDAAFCAAIVENDLPRLLDWDNEFLEVAKVDAYWQTLILMGALGHTPLTGELLSYEAPTYFGMAVAAYSGVSRTANTV